MARALQRTPSEISVAPSGPQSAAADRYERVRLLGQGSYGKVYLVRERRSGETLVMKVISLAGLSKKDRAESLREAETLQKISHPNIIRYVESFVANRTLYIVTEHAAKGDLERLIQSRMGRRLPEDQIVRIFTQVCAAVAHLHEHHIIHRDLKPANIFIAADGSVKIGDFGLAKVLAHTMACAKTACGTPYYMAPEICQERPYHNRSDVWALGCILYNMLSGGKHPFDARDLRGLFAKITRGSPEPLSGVPAEARQLVTQLLQRDPRQRPSVTQITSSPYLRGGDVPVAAAPPPIPAAGMGGPAAHHHAAGAGHLRAMAALAQGGVPPAASPAPLHPPAGPLGELRAPAQQRPPQRPPPDPPMRAPRRLPPAHRAGGGDQYSQLSKPPPYAVYQETEDWRGPRDMPPRRRLLPPPREPAAPSQQVLGRVDYHAMLGQQRAELAERDAQYRHWRAARPPSNLMPTPTCAAGGARPPPRPLPSALPPLAQRAAAA
eukprot:TRINITY_DN247_c4_g1_i2.p1 TRINITY_DN247_c4_g1~~TRINITY_DN247_c4_g1_i2.p1  ORF type:complete len:531 (+),score=142.75 TRINITY_DN247_c4_g1_i2:114-1595(+)